MLLEFRVKNHFSFRDEYVLKSAILYGANASGKTNLILAMIVSIMYIRESMNERDYSLSS